MVVELYAIFLRCRHIGELTPLWNQVARLSVLAHSLHRELQELRTPAGAAGGELLAGNGITLRCDSNHRSGQDSVQALPPERAMKTYDELVRLALFCANQARTSLMKGVAREAWRLAVEYRDQAAKLGEPPNIGEKPRRIEE